MRCAGSMCAPSMSLFVVMPRSFPGLPMGPLRRSGEVAPRDLEEEPRGPVMVPAPTRLPRRKVEKGSGDAPSPEAAPPAAPLPPGPPPPPPPLPLPPEGEDAPAAAPLPLGTCVTPANDSPYCERPVQQQGRGEG
jgi:hypothetical protein